MRSAGGLLDNSVEECVCYLEKRSVVSCQFRTEISAQLRANERSELRHLHFLSPSPLQPRFQARKRCVKKKMSEKYRCAQLIKHHLLDQMPDCSCVCKAHNEQKHAGHRGR